VVSPPASSRVLPHVARFVVAKAARVRSILSQVVDAEIAMPRSRASGRIAEAASRAA
jgi:hypothetical protein